MRLLLGLGDLEGLFNLDDSMIHDSVIPGWQRPSESSRLRKKMITPAHDVLWQERLACVAVWLGIDDL